MEGNLRIGFVVSKEEVMKRLETNSYYRGERLKEDNGVHAARMQAGADNSDILSDEMEHAIADVVEIVTRNLGRCVRRPGIEARIASPENGDETIVYRGMVQGMNMLYHNWAVVGGIGVYSFREHPLKSGMTYSAYNPENNNFDSSAEVRTLRDDDETVVFDTLGASGFPMDLVAAVQQQIMAYLCDKTLEGWMLINMPAEVNNLAQRSAASAEKLRRLLVERKKPIR